MVFIELLSVFVFGSLGLGVVIWLGFIGLGFRSLISPYFSERTRFQDEASVGEAVQAIMSEKDGLNRLALLLRNTGLNALPHRDGILVVRGGTAVLSGLLDGQKVPGVLGSGTSSAWPSRGMWVSDSAWAALESTWADSNHPVAMLSAIRNAVSPMPYEGGTLAQALLSDEGPLRLPSSLKGSLHIPVSFLTPSEKETVKAVLSKRGAEVTEGDLAASVTVADLIDRAAARQRVKSGDGKA